MAPAGHRDDQIQAAGAHGGDADADGPRSAEREAVEKLREGGDVDAGLSQVRSWPAYQVEVMAAAHRKAFDAIKSVNGGIQVGWTLALIDLQAVDGGEERMLQGRKAAQLDWLDVSNDDDFIGVQTYTRERVGPDGLVARPADSDVTQTGWEVYPQALEHSVRLAAEHAGVPIIVTENGMATSDDAQRIAYTHEALAGVERCIADGIDVRGYTHWTLLDNWEWTSGFAMTFGLIEVNLETFERTPKPSLGWLGSVAQANALPS